MLLEYRLALRPKFRFNLVVAVARPVLFPPIVPGVPVIEAGEIAANRQTTQTVMTLAGLGCLLAAAAVIVALRRLTGTTLIAPAAWTAAALAALSAVLLAGGTASHLRYAAAALTFAPLMAVLGAKRPQNRAWQWVVLTLLGVLWLPAAEWMAYHPGSKLQVGQLQQWFLAVLVLGGLCNYLPTRFWLSAVLASAGQGLLLAGQLPLVSSAVPGWTFPAGAGCVAVAVVLVAAGFPRSSRPEPSLARCWFDFRDAFGLLWGLRVAERFNMTAGAQSWQVFLSWRGFVAADRVTRLETLDDDAKRLAEPVLDNLWLRFVSSEWLATRKKTDESPL